MKRLLLILLSLPAACAATGPAGPPPAAVFYEPEEIRSMLAESGAPLPLGKSEAYAALIARMTKPLPAHSHRERAEVVVVLAGSGWISIGDERHALRPGQAMQIPPGVAHAVTPGPEGVDVAVVRIPPTGDEDVVPVP